MLCHLFTILASKSTSYLQVIIKYLFKLIMKVIIITLKGVLKAVENVNKIIGPALIEKVHVNCVHIIVL